MSPRPDFSVRRLSAKWIEALKFRESGDSNIHCNSNHGDSITDAFIVALHKSIGNYITFFYSSKKENIELVLTQYYVDICYHLATMC